MMNLEETIKQVNTTFLKEAKNSISLLEDMAAMERYMAESYSGRVFIELIQNADDCGSRRICLFKKEDNLYFANDGEPFNSDDVVAISRSGSSLKKRGESIGYRGVGFKSTTALSNNIVIFSSNTFFTFSKKIAAYSLELPDDKVPTVRIPFLINKNELDAEIQKTISYLNDQGYNTVFVFKNADTSKIRTEISEFSPELFIFLRHIETCIISVDDIERQFDMQRIFDAENEHFIYEDCAWKIIRKGSTSLALKEESGKVVSCSEKENVYHCFLPTLDVAPFSFKINADFSTDPSRKHLTLDSITRKTLNDIADLITLKVSDILNGKSSSEPQFLSLLIGQKHFSLVNKELITLLKDKISNIHITLRTGNQILVSEYLTLPNWLDAKEKELLRINAKCLDPISLSNEIYQCNYQVEGFLAEYAKAECDNNILVQIIEDKELLAKLPETTISKITAKVIKKAVLDKRLYNRETNLNQAIDNIKQTRGSKDIVKSLSEELSRTEIDFVNNNTEIEINHKEEIQKSPNKEISSQNNSDRIVKSSKPKVARWRSAEQKVIQIEEFLGNIAEDVSKMNVGYDIESTTSTGEKRYIEVKSIKSETSEFTITNNEYTAAHQYGDKYFVCLVFEDKAIYIQNPLNKLSFVKRIRQWEWVCDEYYGEEILYITD